MNRDKLESLKKEALLLENLLRSESASSESALVVLEQLECRFEQLKAMNTYKTLGRIKLDRYFIESELANNSQLADCYSRFANLAEGLEI